MRLFPQVSPFPTIGSAFVSLILGFVVLSALVLWLDRRFKRISTTRSYEGMFDWSTAGVFLVAGLPPLMLSVYGPEAPFFRSESASISATKCFVSLEWSFVFRLALPALWLAWRRKGPGIAWGIIGLLAAFFSEWFACLVHELSASSDVKVYFISCLGWITTLLQVVLLAGHYRRAWLLLMVPIHWGIMNYLLVSGLMRDERLGDAWKMLPQFLFLLFTCIAMGAIVARPKRTKDGELSNRDSVEFKGVLKSLKRCRALEDPVLSARNIVGRWLLGLGGQLLVWVALGHLILIFSDWKNESADALVSSFFMPALFMTIVGSVVMALSPSGKTRPNAFFVRAFRRDDQTSRLRDQVCVSLGPKGRLLGIRDPRQRFGLFTRLFAILEGAFRYLGSNRCDLEGADRNWLARVLATLYLRHVDLVIIDLREATEAVTVELKVVVQAMTPLRVIWLVDDTHTQAEWRHKVHQLTGGSLEVDAPLNLLDVKKAEESPPTVVVDMVTHVLAESARPEHVAEWQQALVQAHTLARSHVADGDWKTPWYETLGGAICITAPLFAIIKLVLYAADMRFVVDMPLFVVGLVVTIRTLLSGADAFGRKCMLARLGKALAPERGW